ncbi:hypothetical protein CC1G_03124 [Coprinopsis cinerea okayama7|uniref:Uncharacterized protein n=1 Tax=Coprinopsis cinerea (strain Okayama-7 / 130 / ATCC MYA-4618 / FGSC 9003) TaxID=240176 RepID=A8PF11_COPC7|nr:hypothetical protein CC1G_03124 [Coprinopsis cinerea okayama7\|eukprot:XP_001840895.1 hypothetical protein CC1G_03124 [Coprinopsis cinerea okayama7\
MPSNIELAIADALALSSKTQSCSPTPSIAHVISAYIRVAGFADLHPHLDCTSPADAIASSSSSALSDAAVLSAFERALEKHASPLCKAGSEAAKLVARVRRDYWRCVLLASGSQDDELTQLLLESQTREAAAYASVSSPPSPSPQSKSKKAKTPKRGTANVDVDVTDSKDSEDDKYISTPTKAKTKVGLFCPTTSGLESLVGRKNGFPERSQIYLKGQGWKTLYPCPCCGSMVRAREVLRVLDMEAGDEDVEMADATADSSMIISPEPKKRKSSMAKGGRKKTKQVKRGKQVAVKDASSQVSFDPYGPSTSKASM